MGLVDPDNHADHCVADHDVRGRAFAPSRINNSLRFRSGIAPPCEELRGDEALVKNMKRDYIRISPLPDAETALRLIDGWIEDYNEIDPHSALKMASPRQFIGDKSN